MTRRFTPREHLARERLIAAELAYTEIEQTFGAPPGASSAVYCELVSARLGLWQLVQGKGRRM